MIEWIKNTIHPPGIEHKNRLAIFSAIGKVLARVRKDASTAFYAHFPYLADDEKLEEHGKSLLIPHLVNDTPEEYRNRVAAASFFLMKAGERAYIMGQLEERFGSRFIVLESFLSLHTKVSDLTEDERIWALDLFDSLTDPNIYLELSDWFHYFDRVRSQDAASPYCLYRNDDDRFNDTIYRDRRTLRDGSALRKPGIHDRVATVLSTCLADTQVFFEAVSPICTSIALTDTTAIDDAVVASIGITTEDDFIYIMDGVSLKSHCTQSFLDSAAPSADDCMLGMRMHHFHNGNFRRDASTAHNGMLYIPL